MLTDPGKVTDATLAAWHARDPAGNHLFPIKTCNTCGHERPGRSKHCGLCGACIARHDHHCAWVNNCIGAYNLRWFLCFIISNCFMTGYGCVLASVTVFGYMWGNGLAEAKYFNTRTGVS